MDMQTIKVESIALNERKTYCELKENKETSELLKYMVSNQTEDKNKTQLQKIWYECDICKIRLKQKYYLDIHKSLHLNEKPYSCSQCDKSFPLERYLIRHERMHIEGRHTCGVCSKSYIWKSDLKVHLYSHTNDETYKCELCLKDFKRWKYLKAHMRVHTNERPFECDVCDKAFARRETRDKHQRIHEKKPYTCKKCQANFKVKIALLKHIKKSHDFEICSKNFSDLFIV